MCQEYAVKIFQSHLKQALSYTYIYIHVIERLIAAAHATLNALFSTQSFLSLRTLIILRTGLADFDKYWCEFTSIWSKC